MQLKTKIFSRTEALALEELHRETYNAMEGSINQQTFSYIIEGLGIAAVTKFLGGVTGGAASIASLIWNITQLYNDQTNKNYVHGASYTFKAIAELLNSGYQRAEVEILWTKYPSVSTTLELAMGNMPPNVSSGYKILRVQTNSGNWISF